MWLLYSSDNSDGCKAVLDQINLVGCSTPGFVLCCGTGYEDLPIPDSWRVYQSDRDLGLCASMNWCFREFPDEAWYGLILDDEFVYTPDWDKKLVMAAGKSRVAHGNDHEHSFDSISTYIVFGGELLRSLGWWALPGIWHWYLDQVWKQLVVDLSLRRFVPEVRTERKSKSEMHDQNAWRQEFDHQEYLKWIHYTYPDLVKRLEKEIRT